MDLLLQIENIIEKNGSDFELSKLFKEYIAEYKASLPELFKSSQGKDFLVKHTKKLDSILELMYKTVLRRAFGNYMPMRSSIPIAIVALGSYGREQLCVHSDIDLLIVYEDVNGYNTQLIIEKLFYMALDAGLKLGHRVHKVNDLFRASCEDITIRTSLMESRLITGSTFTWHATLRELNRIRLYEPKEFILAKIEEAQRRRKKNPPSMQPNIKESTGGLRDAQLLFWLAQTIYGISNLREMSGILFSDEEYKEYRIALELLFRIRSALHLTCNKQEDRLLLEYIPEVSHILGFLDQKKMVSKVLQAQWRINNFTQIFTKKMVRAYIIDRSLMATLRQNRIGKGFYLLDARLFASYKLKFKPINALLEMLVNLKDMPYQFDAGFLNQFTYAKISNPLSKKTYMLLKELLKKRHTHCFLKLFYDAGILDKLFLNFKKVMHLPQFDGYHHFPVDIHSIKCVKYLENIENDFIKNLYEELSEEEKLLLKIAVLFHDTGKGRKQDHSEVGAKLIVPLVKRFGLSEESINKTALLVRHHTLMSSVAFKENIHNEKTLYNFMSYIQNTKNLKLLYILTYADINGVGGDTYNSFNSKLLFDLYKSALEVCENANRITDASKRLAIEKKLSNNAAFKELPLLLQKKILRIESNLFFFSHTIEDIISIALQAKEIVDYSFNIKYKTFLTIEIFRKIPLNISYLLASLSRLDVGSMEILTLFDDVKYFKIEFVKNITPEEVDEVEQIIANSFDMQREVKNLDILIKKEEVSIDCEHSLTHAQISVQTSNQRGLLAYIMSCFEALHINIVTAKIHSSKHRVKDTFLMEKQNDICNNADKIYTLFTK